MVITSDARIFLQHHAAAYPKRCCDSTKVGDKIDNGGNGHFFYRIDPAAEEIIRTRFVNPNGINLRAIYMASQKTGLEPGLISSGILRRFLDGEPDHDGDRVLQFSTALTTGLMECFEAAVAVQCAARIVGRKNYRIAGGMFIEGELGTGRHAFNIVERDGLLHLVDATNPVCGEPFRPFVRQIVSMTDNGEFIFLDPSQSEGRVYSF